MDLPGKGELKALRKKGEETAAIFVNIRGRIFIKAGEIEAGIGKRRHAAETSRKAVDESGLFERTADKHLYGAAFSPKKGRIC